VGQLASDNQLWWNIAVEVWYQPEYRPKIMRKQAKKLNWKQRFIHLTPFEPSHFVKIRPEQTKEVVIKNETWDPPDPTKLEMRDWYKSDRRNLKTKDVQKKQGQNRRTQFKAAYLSADW